MGFFVKYKKGFLSRKSIQKINFLSKITYESRHFRTRSHSASAKNDKESKTMKEHFEKVKAKLNAEQESKERIRAALADMEQTIYLSWKEAEKYCRIRNAMRIPIEE